DNLNASADEAIIIDGPINYADPRYEKAVALIDADASQPLVSAAAICAKVRRDFFMAELAKKYPVFSFERHVGYGTKTHLIALAKFGPVRGIHRFSYTPVAKMAA